MRALSSGTIMSPSMGSSAPGSATRLRSTCGAGGARQFRKMGWEAPQARAVNEAWQAGSWEERRREARHKRRNEDLRLLCGPGEEVHDQRLLQLRQAVFRLAQQPERGRGAWRCENACCDGRGGAAQRPLRGRGRTHWLIELSCESSVRPGAMNFPTYS